MKSSNNIKSQVFTLAHAMRKQNTFLTWSQCLVQAWKVIKLKNQLREGIVSFSFQKTNGEVREAKGTLSTEHFNYTSKGTSKPSPITLVKYFDMEKNSFRSFRAERILNIAA